MDHIAVSYTADEKVTGIFNKYGEKIQTEVTCKCYHCRHTCRISERMEH